MDEGKKMGLKRKTKPAETLVDSGDDEPIGTLLKKNSRKKSKKTKLIADGGEILAKGVEKMTPENDELVGMDDTLANLRKKLRGSKKNVGSAIASVNESSGYMVESSGPSHDESVKDFELDQNGIYVVEKRCLDSTEGVSSEDATMMEAFKVKSKRKNKRFKVNADTKMAGNPELGDDVHQNKRGHDALRCEKECASESEGGIALEDSLSAFFQKMQTEKSHSPSKLKKGKETQVLDDGRNMNSSAGSESPVWRSKLDSTFVKKSFVPDEHYPEVLICTPGNPSVLNKEIPLNGSFKEAKSEEPTSAAVGESSLSGLRAYPDKMTRVEHGKIKSDDVGDPSVWTNETPDSNNILDGNNGAAPCTEPKDLGTPICEGIENTCDDVKLHSCLYTYMDLAHSIQTQIGHPSGGHNGPVKILDKFPEKSDMASISLEVHEVIRQKSKDEPHKVDIDVARALEPSGASRGSAFSPNMDSPSEGEELNKSCGSSIMVDHQGSHAEDRGSLDDPESKEICLSVGQRAGRNAKKQRHGDMAYEGDIEWEVLMQAPEVLVSHNKTREKHDSLSSAVHAGNGKTAAVAAGLKARAAGPLEKIKFKEVVKRKGGLQEYLECRNHILSVWNKDVTRILLLTELGVSDAPLAGESKRDSLVRDIFTFLDQCGFINFGVPSEKENTDNCFKPDVKLLTEEKHRDTPDANSENGDAFIIGKNGISENFVSEKHADAIAEGNLPGKVIPENGPINMEASESVAPCVLEGGSLNHTQRINSLDAVPLEEASAGLEDLDSIPSCKDENGEIVPATQPDFLSPEQALCVRLAGSVDEAISHTQYDSEPKKNIIVIGAGPAGLTAARHLQRQGFSVTVLEARSRVGGRVFTDRSSLSVPVDLGASIITGVEADVATERRPDPSSLICAQLGLELTVLNSECPLYDTVTGEKVPADLDEDLEAEYNRLLDDMELLVAEKGECAMKISLEEGLEYGLKRRYMTRSGLDDLGAITVESQEASGLRPIERRVMDWHFAHLEYGCAAMLQEVSLPNWNQDDVYGGFGGAHCMIKGGYSAIVESLAEGICIHLDHVVTDISYHTKDCEADDKLHRKVKVSTSNGKEFSGDAVLVTVPLGCLKAESIKFSPPLPQWKYLSIKRLGFGVLNKVVLEFPEVFWDDTIDYFGATAEDRDQRGRCFMFWNVKKTVGAPVLIALVVGKAAVDGQSTSSSDNVSHALLVLRRLFGEDKVPDPVAAVVTDWGRDPYSYGAYSYVAVGSSGEDYDILGRPVESCLFFAGEATCKEHPDTVGGAMMSGLREAVRIIDIMNMGTDYIAEVEAMEAARRHSDIARSEVKDFIRRLDAVEFSSALYKKSLDGSRVSSWGTMLKELFVTAKTTAGRLHLAKELLNLPVGFLKTFASTKEGLSTLNTWILDSMGKDGTQLLRHCVRLLVLVSNDLAAVRLSGVGKTVKQKVCVHTSRDIRAIAFQLVRVWVELFRKEKASKGGLKLLRQSNSLDSKSKSPLVSGKPPLGSVESNMNSKSSACAGHQLHSSTSSRIMDDGPIKLETKIHQNTEEDSHEVPMSDEEKAAFEAAEAARAAAIAAAKALAASGARNASLQAPKILSFHKFAMRGQNTHMDEPDSRKHWSGAAIGRQDCLSEIDSRNCRVRDWSVDFSAAGVHLDNSRTSADNCAQRAHSNEIAAGRQLNIREHSGENIAVDSSFLTKAWVDSAGSMGIKDYSAIERWQCQAAAATSGFAHGAMNLMDEEESNVSSRKQELRANKSSASQVTMNKVSRGTQPRGADCLKKAVVDYVATLLMPLYNAKKIDRDGYKSIMKKAATKVMEQTTDAEKAMAVHEFLDFKRKNKIRAFVDLLIERHMAVKPDAKTGSSEKD